MNIGIVGWGTHFPAQIETSADLVEPTGLPEWVIRDKLGIHQRHVAGPEDSISGMATHAVKNALERAGITGKDVDLVISHGSEYKDHILWNAAGKIQHNIGATEAYGFEIYALCAGGVIALNTARSLMLGDERLEHVVLAAASRENELINLSYGTVRFMYNFGAGAGSYVLKRDADRNLILGSSYITDGSLSETILFTQRPEAIGSGEPQLGDIRGRMDVLEYEWMAERLGEVSLPNYMHVITEAVERSGASMDDVSFLGISQMKPSFHRTILGEMGLTEEQTVFLFDHGHVQTVDQVLALELGIEQGRVNPGDLIVLAGAGGGYTWGAVAVQWGPV